MIDVFVIVLLTLPLYSSKEHPFDKLAVMNHTNVLTNICRLKNLNALACLLQSESSSLILASVNFDSPIFFLSSSLISFTLKSHSIWISLTASSCFAS